MSDLSNLTDDELLYLAAEYNIDSMMELAQRNNPTYREAFREAYIEILGEDPETDWSSYPTTIEHIEGEEEHDHEEE